MKLSEDSASLDSAALNQLNAPEAKELHDLTDQLSSCGVGKIVNLPQIIVVGDQSAGKSSVLEAISHVRFPVKGDVCTRFATELVLRPAKQTHVRVSVRFADKSKPTETFDRSGFGEEDLKEIFQEAKKLMGLAGVDKDFSRDVLRLEIDGPGMYPLTLVDLPGIFQVNTSEQSMQGKKTVDLLVEEYMQQKNSIILVVVTATNQIANQGVLRLAEKHDPDRHRTVGIITKPDLTHPGYSDERSYIQLARNQESAHKLKLGWHVLRNRAEHEESLEQRDKKEQEFFQNSAWAAVSREDLGIAKLRRKLSRVLYEHVRDNIPSVIEDIDDKLYERQRELVQMGLARSTKDQMRSFLLSIASDFQRLAHDGVEGRYNNAFFGELESEDYKLRAQLRNFNTLFNHTMINKGAKQSIIEDNEPAPEESKLPRYLQSFSEKYPYEFNSPKPIHRSVLKAELEIQAAANQGREFPGLPNMHLVTHLFQRQSSPWREIATYHIDQILLVAKAFVDEIFERIIGPLSTNHNTEAILSSIVDPFFAQKKELLYGKLEEILRPYSEGYAAPLDHEFQQAMPEKLAQCFYDRMSASVGKVKMPEEDKIALSLIKEATENVMTEMRENHFGTDEVIYMMNAYYHVSHHTGPSKTTD